MTSNQNVKTCKEYHPAGIHGYIKTVSEENTESKDGTKDTVKCASLKRKLDTEVISMCRAYSKNLQLHFDRGQKGQFLWKRAIF